MTIVCLVYPTVAEHPHSLQDVNVSTDSNDTALQENKKKIKTTLK